MSIFRLAMHQASDGDALILSWGEDDTPHHALIDLGRVGDFPNLKPLLKQADQFELFTITHVDADHIGGAVALFREHVSPITPAHVWFNAHAQLVAANNRLPATSRVALAPPQGEKVSEGIAQKGWPWNQQFADKVVSTDSPLGREPIELPGGLTITLLSPSDKKLAELLPVWDLALQKARVRLADLDEAPPAPAGGRMSLGPINVDSLASRPFRPDTTIPNGSSIAFLAEFAGKRVLLGADAHSDVIEASLRALGASDTCRYRIDCLKVPHHGSKANTSPGLLDLIDCTCFAFSTDGDQHDHPDEETIARLLKKDPKRHKTLIFNFRQANTIIWDNKDLMQTWNYECVFPKDGANGVVIDI